MNRSENISKLLTALIKAQSEMGNAIKDSKNPFFKSNYADLNALRAEALPLLFKNGITILQPPTTFEGKNYIETILAHESGEFISSLNEVIVAKANDPQSYLAAQTYTRRGAFQAVLCMGAEDDDGNFASGKTNKLEVTKAPVLASNAVLEAAITGQPPKLTEAQATATVKAPSFSRNKKPATSTNDLGI
jgi:hypothetical protein